MSLKNIINLLPHCSFITVTWIMLFLIKTTFVLTFWCRSFFSLFLPLIQNSFLCVHNPHYITCFCALQLYSWPKFNQDIYWYSIFHISSGAEQGHVGLRSLVSHPLSPATFMFQRIEQNKHLCIELTQVHLKYIVYNLPCVLAGGTIKMITKCMNDFGSFCWMIHTLNINHKHKISSYR